MIRFLFAVLIFAGVSATAQAQYSTSNTTCSAYTSCYDGYGRYIGQISCSVYGWQTVQNYGYNINQNSCRWNVVPYQSVSCAGYQSNGYAYTWQRFDFRCPGY